MLANERQMSFGWLRRRCQGYLWNHSVLDCFFPRELQSSVLPVGRSSYSCVKVINFLSLAGDKESKVFPSEEAGE